ncbi:MAG: preprotein translocase subunit SecY [Spirochaetota bacterium]|jgi:preprotein translocase subunit SecY|nr:preprotein translocase subunit SecY [Spirochaetota bacterium]
MAGIFKNIFTIQELRKRIFFTVAMLFVFRMGAHIPVPGIDLSAMDEVLRSGQQGGLLGLIDLFSGGALLRFSLFGLGIMPYITSSIIMQLLVVVIPSLARLQREGDAGRKKIQSYTRYGTILVSAVQGYGYLVILRGLVMRNPALCPYIGDPIFMIGFIATVVTGTVFLMWIGEQITERGLGNGISVLIFAGIAARMPEAFYQTFTLVSHNVVNPVVVLLLLGILMVVIGLVVYEQTGTRKIPVQYAKRVVGRRVMQGQSTHIPFKINPSGVIPIIFASSVILFPAQIAQFAGDSELMVWLQRILDPRQSWFYYFCYTMLVIFFAYFYTSIQYNPNEIADNLQKQGGFIPGIRPGPTTAEFIHKVLSRITLPGSLFLSGIALFPSLLLLFPIFANVPPSLIYLMGGTSLIIIVSVDLDIMKRIESYLLMRHYDGFFGRTRLRGPKPRGL